ncbi:MAG: carboxypeptidase regulatory-like domain-containing protein, partial [Pirellulales bacterium]
MIRNVAAVECFLSSTAILALCGLAAADDITGRVVDTSGKPLAGATVQISTAAPKVGVSVYCPSCYADCGKHATTDADGKFAIQNLDPSLTFRLVAVVEGHRAGNSGRIDPLGDKANFQLAPLPSDLDPKQAVRGRIVDQDGKPVIGAVVSPVGCKQGDRRWGGSVPGVDALSITNRNGEFLITASAPADAFDLEVKSPRHAARRFELVDTGSDVHELHVEIGSFVRGVLLAKGQPVGGALLGLVQTDRSSDTFLGEQQIGTRPDGSFEFS